MASRSGLVEDEGGPLLAALVDAERRTSAMFGGERLIDVVSALVDLARERCVESLAGASEAGDRLVGAMVLGHSALRPWSPGDRRVLVVDGVVVTPYGVETKASTIRALGACEVHGAVVDMVDLPPGAGAGALESLTSVTSFA